MSKIKISVTKDDIWKDREERTSMGEVCMVAEAIRRRLDLPSEVEVNVGYSTFEIAGKKGGVKITLPRAVGSRIKRWDSGAKTREFEFEVEFPDDWRKQLGK